MKKPYSLIAACGMNCGLCYAFLRKKNKCPGCRNIEKNCPISILKCKIRNCPKIKGKKAEFCYQCDEFPCTNLKHLDKRYQTKYGMSEIENLESIKQNGIRKFIKNEKERWECKKCGGMICVHKNKCLTCASDK